MNYRHIYMQIISAAKNQQKLGLRVKYKGIYYEAHHILPKSLFPNWTKRKSNTVLLTAREHYFCHQLLTKIYPTREMFCALFYMMQDPKKQGLVVNQREYEKLRLLVATDVSKRFKGKSSKTKDCHWYTNGEVDILRKSCPEGFRRGVTYCSGTKQKWWTNGEENIKAEVCPNGFWRGLTRFENKYRWFTNGVDTVYALSCPKGFWEGMGSKGCKGKFWVTNGTENRLVFEIPLGFRKGFTKNLQNLYGTMVIIAYDRIHNQLVFKEVFLKGLKFSLSV